MKTIPKLTLILGLTVGSTVGFAQESPAPAASEPANNPAEVVPLIVIDEAPLIEAVKTLARQASINFILDPRLTNPEPGPDGKIPVPPNVTIRFENVTAEDALISVLETYSLTMVRDPRTRVARITIQDPAALPPLVTRVVQLNYANPTNLVSVLVPTMVDKRSRVLADGRTRKLIIVATEKDQEAGEELIKKLDLKTEQVLIEGAIVETSKNPKTIKGIDWTGTLSAQNFTLGNDPAGSGAVSMDTSGGGLNFNPNTAFLRADGVSAVLSFLNSQTDSEVMSTPRTVTLDNMPARLEVTTAFPIFKITPGSANSPAGAEITYTNLGTILTVTPRIAADNNVSLTVSPEVSNLAGKDSQQVSGDGGSTEVTANIYAIRRFETTVLVPSGNTIVMGGLMNDESTDKLTKVPILGDLPGVGRAFRSNDKVRLKKNLLVFLTPTILRDDDFKKGTTAKEFLQSSYGLPADIDDSNAWESAKPHDWRKPVY
jgi:type II secretory pathway component GspD/PulD (secretin)